MHSSDRDCILVLIVTGPVGVGKTTIAEEVSRQLSEASVPNAWVDVDLLRTCYPSPPDDPFHMALGLANLAAVCANYRAAGAERLVLADVVEAPEAVPCYEEAIPGARITVVRLSACIETLHGRLDGREEGEDLRWHRNRAVELTGIMESTGVGDLIIRTDGRRPAAIASEALQRARWWPSDQATDRSKHRPAAPAQPDQAEASREGQNGNTRQL
ncbi:MAG TPA: hypothetical protein VGN26_23095 [Armatimonadota bacterium]|jgi:hypothetical protein